MRVISTTKNPILNFENPIIIIISHTRLILQILKEI